MYIYIQLFVQFTIFTLLHPPTHTPTQQKTTGHTRQTGFDITVASEIMAVLALTTGLEARALFLLMYTYIIYIHIVDLISASFL